MARPLHPIYCLADSQLLFWREDGRAEPWLARVRSGLPEAGARAAYLGASNGDDPAFYSIFRAAAEGVGIEDHRMVLSRFDGDDRAFLASADLVVLAGGDPVLGWRLFEQSGLQEAILGRYFEGATLLGVSAGAVQLGWLTAPEGAEPEPAGLIHTFRLVPAVVGVHEEGESWRRLRRLISLSGTSLRGLGIPAGGGLLYHPDGVVEPVRYPVHELVPEAGGLRQSLLVPGESAPIEPVSAERAH